MPRAEYLREHAKTLINRSRGRFDLGTASRLQLTAQDMTARVEELEDRDHRSAPMSAFFAKSAGKFARS